MVFRKIQPRAHGKGVRNRAQGRAYRAPTVRVGKKRFEVAHQGRAPPKVYEVRGHVRVVVKDPHLAEAVLAALVRERASIKRRELELVELNERKKAEATREEEVRQVLSEERKPEPPPSRPSPTPSVRRPGQDAGGSLPPGARPCV